MRQQPLYQIGAERGEMSAEMTLGKESSRPRRKFIHCMVEREQSACCVRRCGRFVKLVGLLGIVGVPMFFLGGCNYSCGNGVAHCYGTVTFGVPEIAASGFQGFATGVTAVPLKGGNGELNNEIWAVQYQNPSCGSDLRDECWIEVGLSAGAYGLPSNETHIFWADNRPNGAFHFHDQGALQAQELNHEVFLLIKPHLFATNTFDVDAQTCADVTDTATCDYRWIIGKSTNNAISVGRLVMGMELSGKNGASAPNANFTGTVVLDPNAPFGGRYLTSFGTMVQDAPVNAGWTATPSSSGFGGIFSTSCCQ
jgi:hypothetical protein